MTEAASEARLRTQAFARVIGPYVTIFATVVAIRLPDLTGMIRNLFANPAIVWILGGLMIGGGLLIIGGHRNWRGPAAIAISLFGWFVAIRGLALIATTSVMQDAVDATTQQGASVTVSRVLIGLVGGLFGGWLTYTGWFPGAAKTSRTSPVVQR